jgi:hypothetical protein
MNADPRDEIDRALDEVLASVVVGEPRRVNATSVREAIEKRRGPRVPLWLAVAAVLVVGFAVALKDRTPVAPAPASVAKSTETAVPSEARPARSPEPIQVQNRFAVVASWPLRASTTADLPYEGLPRLTIASIEPPVALSTIRLEAGAIQIPRIEIEPLFVSGLSIQQEHNQ